MPWKSDAQRKFMWAKHPKIAKRWSEEYETPKNLPEHVDDKKPVEKAAWVAKLAIEAATKAGCSKTMKLKAKKKKN